MAKFVILDNNVGLVQFVTDADDAAGALAAFDADVGIDMATAENDFSVFPVTDKAAAALEAWAAIGAPAADYPLDRDGKLLPTSEA